ncbi:hypothetical protein N7504_003011 [Penicillium tannophilum]|nr:hypothetical protein N7504_003011 [Penicillium tannophilum]
MRGKNTGRRRSTKRQTNVPLNAPECGYLIRSQCSGATYALLHSLKSLTLESKALMHRSMLSSFGYRQGFLDISDALLLPRFCSKFDIRKSIWETKHASGGVVGRFVLLVSTVSTTKNADFHSTLAISASYVDFSHRKPGISRKFLHHISVAFALVNTRLSGPFSISDSAIAAVVSLAIYQQIHNQPENGFVHLHRLCRMIELRGVVH